jgi:hypothetical protein
MLCFASPPPPAPPHSATSTFPTPSGAMKRPSLPTSIVQGAASPSSPALTLRNLSPTTTCCTTTSCLSPTSPGTSSRWASVSSRLRIMMIPRATTGSRTHLPSQVWGHHSAPQIRPTRPHPSALAPSCHVTPPPSDPARIRTDLPPTYLTTPSILPFRSDTSDWGATMRSQVVVMGGCPR